MMNSCDGTKRDSWKDDLAIESACDRFEDACRAPASCALLPRIEDFLERHREPVRSQLLHRLLVIELDYRRQAGQSPGVEDYLARFPADGDAVLAAFRSTAEPPSPQRLPDGYRLAVYTIRGLLGQGGMGAVYRAWDERRQQEVALKVIRADRWAGSSPPIRQRWAEQLSREAQAAGCFQHPAIVPLLDFGEFAGQPYLAMQLIEGKNLRDVQAEESLPVRRAVEIVRAIAEALDCLHQHEIYHCDVKPSNILIDAAGRPYLSDFGLALAEEQIPAAPGLAGTAAYMSPEQARGEGHLVDGRTDVFSLAVVLYELLAGEHPFQHRDREKVLERVRQARVVPLAQRHPEIPAELDRICLRALSRLADDRYGSAREFAQDLCAFLNPVQDHEVFGDAEPSPPSRIDLRGMAAFGPEDARSYPALVPGPRTRAGLPVSLASWLDGIAATVRGRVFRVGLIYGPSGSGKSSLVRAGILPRLPPHVVAAYVDGSEDTDAALRQVLQARLAVVRGASAPAPPTSGESLPALMAAVRRSRARQDGERGNKLLIVIDHFEHWLHGHPQPAGAELTAALRQCDGVGVQCLLLVREEFRTPATRLLRELNLEFSPQRRECLVDLFDPEHARRVLMAMGRSCTALPAEDEKLTDEQRRFLERAVRLLEHEGRVVPALLAMFVEYMRDKPWTADSLAALGDADSLAAAFFDDLLRRAVGGRQPGRALEMVAAILRALLPQTDSEGQRLPRSEEQLLAAAGGRRPDLFRAVLEALCRQARILTLVESSPGPTASRNRRYQLAHDSLLPLVRAWLQLKQQEHWWGRHVQRMAEHGVAWSRRPTSALLPSPTDWGIQLLVDGLARLGRSFPASSLLQRRLMRAATSYYLRRTAWLILLAAVTIVPLVWYVSRHQQLALGTAAEILLADADRLSGMLHAPSGRSWTVLRRLRQELDAEVPADASELAKDAAAGRRANAVAALCLADPQQARRIGPLLKNAPDPRGSTALVHHLAPAGVDPQLLIQAYRDQTDADVRQALLLALGQYSAEALSQPLRDGLLPMLQADYTSHPDAGLHAAIQWLLRRWGRGQDVDRLNRQLETAGWNPAHDWYHTPSGHLMIVLRAPVEFTRGSPAGEYGRQPDEGRHRVRIESTFAISATEVTERQFRESDGASPAPSNSASDQCPIRGNVYWNEAARYCHDLTEREGLSAGGEQLVYRPKPDNPKRYRPVADALGRTGYRLPTETEWEYACRAGTTTCRFFGETTLYMASYAWSYDNGQERAHPVASLMPNRFGLFDMLGNVSEWCHDVYDRKGDEWSASIRGGSAWSSPVKLRSAARYHFSYRHTDHRVGFRIARTLPPSAP